WASVQGRTWPVLCEQLVGYYEKAIAVQERRRVELARRLLTAPSLLAARVFG
ncbi:alpha-mannosyltransferase, partial [Micrococcus luteus]|nr:alpha-mannosyltransferase [Micrococcus luteus]